jgi:hypothetical protein
MAGPQFLELLIVVRIYGGELDKYRYILYNNLYKRNRLE